VVNRWSLDKIHFSSPSFKKDVIYGHCRAYHSSVDIELAQGTAILNAVTLLNADSACESRIPPGLSLSPGMSKFPSVFFFFLKTTGHLKKSNNNSLTVSHSQHHFPIFFLQIAITGYATEGALTFISVHLSAEITL